MAAVLLIHSRKSNISPKQNILRLCASFTGCVWSWRFKQKASLSPITLEVRFFASLVSMFFRIGTHAWTLHWGTHTQHSWQPYRHWVTWYTYNSIVILHCYADDFKTAKQIACRVSECETSVTALSNHYFRSVASVYSYHTSATVTTKVELQENRTVATRHTERKCDFCKQNKQKKKPHKIGTKTK